MDTSNSKAAIVDKIKKSSTILVTVSRDPSVDALAAALSFSLMLNKIDKSSTAVFSGAVPPAITFLEPEKNFEGTVDSLRDFIIALDKTKADRLRYKVEGDVVRIYITPYKTNLSENDLEFSQGDFNVDLVIALGVDKQSDLDSAISAHGRILHDATVATINNRDVKSSLGTIDWNDGKASSLCEMLMSLSEALGSNLLDDQIATGLLTGIVAATNRFSNEHTTPRVMTMSAQLMAAGANQQLIAEKLQAGGVSFDTINVRDSDTTDKAPEPEPTEPEPTPEDIADGVMHVDHDDKPAAVTDLTPEDNTPTSTNDLDSRLDEALGRNQPLDHLRKELEAAAAQQAESSKPSTDWRDHVHDPGPMPDNHGPILGGTLNATTSQAEATNRAEERAARNGMILSHGQAPKDPEPVVSDTPANDQAASNAERLDDKPSSRGKTLQPVTMQPINSPLPVLTPPPMPAVAPEEPIQASVSPAGMSYEESPLPQSPPQTTPPGQTLADLEAEVHAAAAAHPATSSLDDARSAVTQAFDQSLSVGGQPANVPAQAHDQPVVVAPPMPPMPDFSTLPPLPPLPSQPIPASPHPAVAPPAFPLSTEPEVAPAPGQFRIPGQ